jgi:tRNA modification GTPase
MINKTIAAISTPLGPGGIGVIRISGPDACAIMRKLFIRQTGSKKQNDPSGAVPYFSHRVYYGHIIFPGTGEIIDEVIAFLMKGPKSFTREDVVEFHSHSGFVVLDRILGAVVDVGATLAVAGEFTKRAFLNGRIDLTQAESVIDLINAPCETAVRLASQQIAGGLRDHVKKISDRLSSSQAKCEASIEFAEEMDCAAAIVELQKTIQEWVLPEIAMLIQRQKDTAIFKEGLLLAIAGVPNVGKSSLLNQLVERETAIVSEISGTTRDIVREYFSINGVPVVICDTAGIHETNDPVECLGIAKAREHIQRADIVLLVLEAIREPNAFEERLLDEIAKQKTIVVINKVDLADDRTLDELKKKLKNICHTSVSAKFGLGIAGLKNLIFKEFISAKRTVTPEWVSPNLRQRKILEIAMSEIQRCCKAAEKQEPIELVSELLKKSLSTLEKISGNRTNDDLYDNIFSQFCIGK